MYDTAVARTEHELRMVEALVDCAHALSVAVAEAAKAEADGKLRLQMFEAFQRGFLAVRMGIRLSLMLRAAPKSVARPAAEPAREAPERERPEAERPETEQLLDRLERDEPALERERDRDYEPVSLPRFLSTLGVVASEAARIEALPAHVRADILPKLDTLLARAKGPAAPPAQPAAAVALMTRSKALPKAALLSGASTLSGPPPTFHGRPRPPPYRFG
ncbi:hypothetical protein [Phenylobacterium sp.]|jgi:hypothetical protein|uniref:hypothetical protein n=1 Tax=Phenylobacterium sp. TaxID=1871053 RepID=UPI0037C87C00